jgi:hypothetical protein
MMGRPGGDIPPLFQDLPGDDAPNGERNALAEVPAKLTPLEHYKYEVADELKSLIYFTITFAAVTTWVFPFLPDTVIVGGWALWWLGGVITTVMEWVAQQWIAAVVLGGLSFFLAGSLVVVSHWLKAATKTEQYLMYCSTVLIIPNVLAIMAIVALWLAVIGIWVAIAALAWLILGLVLLAIFPNR